MNSVRKTPSNMAINIRTKKKSPKSDHHCLILSQRKEDIVSIKPLYYQIVVARFFAAATNFFSSPFDYCIVFFFTPGVNILSVIHNCYCLFIVERSWFYFWDN